MEQGSRKFVTAAAVIVVVLFVLIGLFWVVE